jgi:hypothetical protein
LRVWAKLHEAGEISIVRWHCLHSVELAAEDKEWRPKLRYELYLPDTAAGGKYRIAVQVEDKVSLQRISHAIPFQVDAPAFDPSLQFGITKFRFVAKEDAPDSLPAATTFAPGDTVWAKFEIAGFKLAEKNKYDVRYGIALRDSTGKQLFEQPEAARDSAAPDYPKRAVGGMFSINLDKKIRPGTYTLLVRLHDAVGGQKLESTYDFKVE